MDQNETKILSAANIITNFLAHPFSAASLKDGGVRQSLDAFSALSKCSPSPSAVSLTWNRRVVSKPILSRFTLRLSKNFSCHCRSSSCSWYFRIDHSMLGRRRTCSLERSYFDDCPRHSSPRPTKSSSWHFKYDKANPRQQSSSRSSASW